MPRQVLIVEDDLAFVALIQLALKDLDFEFHVARDGRQALELLPQRPYDLLIADYRLPHVDGVEIAKATVQRWPGCQIILISATRGGEISRHLKNLPIVGFIEKPFSPIQFRELVVKAQ